jgi:hypothetical protein
VVYPVERAFRPAVLDAILLAFAAEVRDLSSEKRFLIFAGGRGAEAPLYPSLTDKFILKRL